MAQPNLTSSQTPGARVDGIERGWRLSIPSGKNDKYRLAQLFDYALLSRGQFSHRFPLHFSLLSRTSSDAIPGTWGFGLWNDPFGFSLGFGGNQFRLPALPNAAWFFGASKENYLSFKDSRAERSDEGTSRSVDEAPLADRPSTVLRSAQGEIAANGFIAQTFRSRNFHPLLIPAGLVLPFSRKVTRRMLGKVIGEDGISLGVNPTDWHRYSLTWEEKRVAYEVDGVKVFESQTSPNPPLGLVIWIDNQYVSFTPDGKIGFGVLANPEPAWLEIKDFDIG